MDFVIFFVGLLFIGIGFILTKNNARYLLAGYNTMTEQARKEVDIVSLVTFFRRFHLFLGISFIIGGLTLTKVTGTNAGGIFLAVYPILAYIYYFIQSRRHSGMAYSSINKVGMYVLIAALVFILFLFGYGIMENKLLINQETIEFKGSYGELIPLKEIEYIEMTNTLPDINMKINGFALGEVHKGYFRTSDGERIKLLLNSDQIPFILVFKKSGERIFYSAKKEMNEEMFIRMNRVLKE